MSTELPEITHLEERVAEQDWLREAALAWIEGIVCKPDSRLNREGALCPCLSWALQARKVYAVPVQVPSGEVWEKTAFLKSVFHHVLDFFEAMRLEGESSPLDCAIISVGNLLTHEIRYVMDGLYGELRPYLLEKGYMFGSFHPFNRRHSRLNKDFYSMRVETPMFGFRRLSSTDGMNLHGDPVLFEIFKKYFPAYEAN